ncbi:MAG: rod shape-determining protein MreD [Steroidobacteraceae bacterium]
MNIRESEPRGRMLVSAFIALILSILPLPHWLEIARPAFLVLTVLYWSIAAPRAGGLALGFASGLTLDVFRGAVLGQHALALTTITYVAVREHQKIRSKPAFQQALIVLAALVAYEFILFAIDGWSGHPMTSPLRWIRAGTGALVWPLATALLARTHSRR